MKNLIITIARSYGSGGRIIGKALSEALNIPYYDRQLLRFASDISGISENLFGKADESPSRLRIFNAAKSVYTGEVLPPDSDDFTSTGNLFSYQAKVIKELAKNESCIIIGRCGDYILRDDPSVIKVFMYAPMRYRARRIADLDGLSEKAARKKIESVDKRRAAYYSYYTGWDWRDVEHYDLCINTAVISLDEIIRMIKDYSVIRQAQQKPGFMPEQYADPISE